MKRGCFLRPGALLPNGYLERTSDPREAAAGSKSAACGAGEGRGVVYRAANGATTREGCVIDGGLNRRGCDGSRLNGRHSDRCWFGRRDLCRAEGRL